MALGEVVNGDQVKQEDRRYEKGEGDEELGELAQGKQADLKVHAWRSVPSNGIAIKSECTPAECEEERHVHEIVRAK